MRTKLTTETHFSLILIFRTPKQQKPRKKLLLALTEPDEKEDEMEGVTSLVMFPQLVDNKDTITSIQHQLATGQWARCLEQDLKKNEISTVGDLAGLDNNAVRQLRGIKPPKQQTVKTVLAHYYNKLRREENVVRKGTPVQEETTQEEEDRIKADIFSRPSPSPTDMADIDSSQDHEETKEESNELTKEDSNERAEEDSIKEAEMESNTDNKEDSNEKENVEEDSEKENKENSVKKDNVEEDTHKEAIQEESNEKNSNSEITQKKNNSVMIIPETQSFEEEVEKTEKGNKIDESPIEINTEDVPVVSVGPVDGLDEEVTAPEDGMEVEETPAALVENTPDSAVGLPSEETPDETGEAAQRWEEEENIEKEEEDVTPVTETPNTVNENDIDIVSIVNDTDFDLNNLTTVELKTLIRNLFEYSKKVGDIQEKAVQVLTSRIK